jgi:Uma2 family endonuclease
LKCGIDHRRGLRDAEQTAVTKPRLLPFDVILTDLNVFQPDLAFFSRERRNVLTDKGAEGAPDLVIEILSARPDIDQKRPHA